MVPVRAFAFVLRERAGQHTVVEARIVRAHLLVEVLDVGSVNGSEHVLDVHAVDARVEAKPGRLLRLELVELSRERTVGDLEPAFGQTLLDLAYRDPLLDLGVEPLVVFLDVSVTEIHEVVAELAVLPQAQAIARVGHEAEVVVGRLNDARLLKRRPVRHALIVDRLGRVDLPKLVELRPVEHVAVEQPVVVLALEILAVQDEVVIEERGNGVEVVLVHARLERARDRNEERIDHGDGAGDHQDVQDPDEEPDGQRFPSDVRDQRHALLPTIRPS